MGAMTPGGRVYTLVRQESLNGLHCIEFLLHLLRVAGDRLLVIWDGSPIHRRAEVKEFLGSKAGRGIWVERLPGYAPDLNPCEGLWANLKGGALANRAEETIGQVAEIAHRSARRAAHNQQLLFGFLAQTGLSF